VRGSGGLNMADPQAMQAVAFRLQNQIRKNAFFSGARSFGTPGLVSLMQPIGRFPTQNFRYGSFNGYESITGETLREKHLERDVACFSCPIGCDKIYRRNPGRVCRHRQFQRRIRNPQFPGSASVRQLPAGGAQRQRAVR